MYGKYPYILLDISFPKKLLKLNKINIILFFISISLLYRNQYSFAVNYYYCLQLHSIVFKLKMEHTVMLGTNTNVLAYLITVIWLLNPHSI